MQDEVPSAQFHMQPPPLPESLSQSLWQEDLCNTPEMEGGDGEYGNKEEDERGSEESSCERGGGGG